MVGEGKDADYDDKIIEELDGTRWHIEDLGDVEWPWKAIMESLDRALNELVLRAQAKLEAAKATKDKIDERRANATKPVAVVPRVGR